jgi:hypothetical protein
MTSQSTSASYQQNSSAQKTPYSGSHYIQYNPYQGLPSAYDMMDGGFRSGIPPTASASWGHNSVTGQQNGTGMIRMSGTSKPSGQDFSSPAGQLRNESLPSRHTNSTYGTMFSSGNSSVTMADLPFVDPQRFALFQQQQIALQQQQQQQQQQQH